ncbi:hypothetical protein NONI108955_41190 [Nocardia ninae]|uniref:DUF3310 domain-containing protein n=1 Tax=Nocardia ninae NBRC 108245 TaxID=1210091 RepID=A0A511MLU5_9NOCA|nr:hypothetical protein [Nocardia ninae]GEM40886.1 hypothetical protein NN4_54050 [Nocardia ninae NBRC 108245]
MNSKVDPPYYQGFSNGAEMIDITENLTPNAAQAVQYIGRSCRMDGNNKGGIAEDLNKALWFITRELCRIGAETQARPRDSSRRIARMWGRIEDVPEGVEVTDIDGDGVVKVDGITFRTSYGRTGLLAERFETDGTDNDYAPFTEVIA